jgi:hypothetical protein
MIGAPNDSPKFFFRNIIQTYAHSTPISTSKKLSWLDLKIHEISHQEYLSVDRTSPSTKKIISLKYNTHIKSRI